MSDTENTTVDQSPATAPVADPVVLDPAHAGMDVLATLAADDSAWSRAYKSEVKQACRHLVKAERTLVEEYGASAPHLAGSVRLLVAKGNSEGTACSTVAALVAMETGEVPDVGRIIRAGTAYNLLHLDPKMQPLPYTTFRDQLYQLVVDKGTMEPVLLPGFEQQCLDLYADCAANRLRVTDVGVKVKPLVAEYRQALEATRRAAAEQKRAQEQAERERVEAALEAAKALEADKQASIAAAAQAAEKAAGAELMAQAAQEVAKAETDPAAKAEAELRAQAALEEAEREREAQKAAQAEAAELEAARKKVAQDAAEADKRAKELGRDAKADERAAEAAKKAQERAERAEERKGQRVQKPAAPGQSTASPKDWGGLLATQIAAHAGPRDVMMHLADALAEKLSDRDEELAMLMADLGTAIGNLPCKRASAA